MFFVPCNNNDSLEKDAELYTRRKENRVHKVKGLYDESQQISKASTHKNNKNREKDRESTGVETASDSNPHSYSWSLKCPP